MKVLHVNDYYDRVGGAEVILFQTLQGLEESNVTNVVVHQHPNPAADPSRQSYQIQNLGDPDSSRDSTIEQTFRDILHKENPDVIHLYYLGNPRIAEISVETSPTVQSVFNHNFYCPGGQKYLPHLGRVCHKPFGVGCYAAAFLTHCNSIRPRTLAASHDRCSQTLGNRSLTFLPLSQYQADRLCESGVEPNRVTLLPPFTNLPLQEPMPAESPPMILFAGRVTPQKGLDTLLRSLVRVQTPFCFVVAGDGLELPNAKRLADKLGLSYCTKFLGWTSAESTEELYRRASLVVVPSIWPEPFGMVGIEAMSHSKPVVAFRVGGIPEWLSHRETGILIEPYDENAMTQAIDELLTKPDMALAMGRRGRERVEKEFTKQRYVTKLLAVYKDAIAATQSKEHK